MIPPTHVITLDTASNRLQNDTSSIRLIPPLVNNYHPYYPDSYYGFDPYIFSSLLVLQQL